MQFLGFHRGQFLQGKNPDLLSDEEKALAAKLGKRVAEIAAKLEG